MSAIVTLFDPSTGIRVDCKDEYAASISPANFIWQWTEGNYGCDCNKRLFMARAGAPGYSADASIDTDCGEGIVLEKIVAEDGNVLFEYTP